jgi:hypothetical protein
MQITKLLDPFRFLLIQAFLDIVLKLLQLFLGRRASLLDFRGLLARNDQLCKTLLTSFIQNRGPRGGYIPRPRRNGKGQRSQANCKKRRGKSTWLPRKGCWGPTPLALELGKGMVGERKVEVVPAAQHFMLSVSGGSLCHWSLG